MSTSEVPRQTAEAAVSPTAVQQQERLTESARVLRVRRFPPVVQFLTPLDEAERAALEAAAQAAYARGAWATRPPSACRR